MTTNNTSNITFKKIFTTYTRELVKKKIPEETLIRDYGMIKVFPSETSLLTMTVAEYSKTNHGKQSELLTKYQRQGFDPAVITNNYANELNNDGSITDVLSQFDSLSKLQETIRDDIITNIHKCHGYCFNASCGDGKTVASIYLMSQLRVKTLIISSRNAVNDQWKHELTNLFPNLKIVTRVDDKKPKPTKKAKTTDRNNDNDNVVDNVNDTDDNSFDVLICTPQYLFPKIQQYLTPSNKNNVSLNKFFGSLHCGLIIYDELHSLLSDQFSLVLSLPFILKSKNIVKQTPYVIGLTASLPNSTTSDYKLIKSVFGEPLRFPSAITNIPVKFIDYRDTLTEQERGFCDRNYRQPIDEDVCKHYTDVMIERRLLPSTQYKMIVITSTIDSSIRCGLQTCLDFKQDVLVMRAVNETSMWFKYEVVNQLLNSKREEIAFLTEDSIRKEHKELFTTVYVNDNTTRVVREHTLYSTLPRVSIIVGTYHRLKEGFNCKNIVYGICTKFIWSETSRVQILGRIRRSSNDEALNKHSRYFFVCSGKIPSNLYHHRPHEKIEIKYDLSFENQLFQNENYVRCKLKK